MKTLIFLFCALCTIFYAGTVLGSPLTKPKECSLGPSYWCKNITTSSTCRATKHCIQTVWEHMKIEEDSDSVCQICTEMVKEARDQLQSNETQEELQEVFEGSCKLIPLKVISKECCKMVDDFIPDLVDALASQMNPQVVCSVAGLCNNARIDKLLAEKTARDKKLGLADDTKVNEPKALDCNGCHSVAGKMESGFNGLSRDQVLEGMMRICGRGSSFSDMCSNIVLSYFNDIYDVLKRDLTSDNVCHMSGVCSDQFHQHDTAVEIISHGSVGVRPVDDDLPCDLCSQLVGHLRDLLVANTTEDEFQQVLDGICGQMKSNFKQECKNIVDEYYPTIYNFLIKELDPKEVCVMANLCPGPGLLDSKEPLMPLLTSESIQNSKLLEGQELIGTDETNSYKNKNLEIQEAQLPLNRILLPESLMNVKIDEVNKETAQPGLNAMEIQNAQLPIDRIFPQSLLGVHSNQACAFCEYVLHFIQVEISNNKNEKKIEDVIKAICDKLPQSVSGECDSFVQDYAEALISLFAEEIDPSQICPMLSICPKGNKDVEVLMHLNYNDKPNCPLCLFAVKQLEDMVKEEKTEENIKKALDELCVALPKDLSSQCNDFVESYTKELIEMLLADLNPQEVCVYLKVCDPKAYKDESKMDNSVRRDWSIDEINNGGDILTNEIPDITVGGQVEMQMRPQKLGASGPPCVLCKAVTEQVLKALNGSVDPEDIKRVLHKSCDSCPKKQECNQFVTKYFDTLVDIISKHVDPEDICSLLFLCVDEAIQARESVAECVICEELVSIVHQMLKNPNVDHDIEHLMKKACTALPKKNEKQCEMLMVIYGKTIIEMLAHEANAHQVCKKISLCSTQQGVHIIPTSEKPHLLGRKECTWGPSYWCTSLDTANQCKALEHCQTNVWKKASP